MKLHLQTWPEVERYLERSRAIILPIGATEQHGPIGLIGTDAICAEALAIKVGERASALVVPVIPFGMSQHHMEFPGSVTLRPSTLLTVVCDIVFSLARHGFRRFWFINGHGGNIATLEAAFSQIYYEVSSQVDDMGELRCETTAWWETPSAQRLSRELFGDADGDHATASEVSLALSVYPDHRKDEGELEPAQPTSAIFTPQDFRRRYPDGRMGSDPTLASSAHGRAILDGVVTDLTALFEEFRQAD